MSPRDLRSYIIDNATAGIAAYRSDYRSEVVTSPTKIFDYFSLGLPVIAASMPTITSVMSDGREGLLYKAGDPESLADTIRNLLSDQSRYCEMHKNALRAAEEFSYSNRAKRLISFIMSQTGKV
jgi:glycosyltransferase involved in cell wall biosynthesis